MVNEIFRSATGRGMIEELYSETLVYGEHPVADVVNLMKQSFLVSFKDQSGDRAENETGLSRGNVGGRRGDCFGQASEQLGELFGFRDRRSGAVTGTAMPRDNV